jgi:hypothetical protein
MLLYTHLVVNTGNLFKNARRDTFALRIREKHISKELRGGNRLLRELIDCLLGDYGSVLIDG